MKKRYVVEVVGSGYQVRDCKTDFLHEGNGFRLSAEKRAAELNAAINETARRAAA